MKSSRRYLEKSIATASFVVAVALAFTSIMLSSEHDIAANIALDAWFRKDNLAVSRLFLSQGGSSAGNIN